MEGTTFVSLETVEGIVRAVEGTIATGIGVELIGGARMQGKKTTDALNYCARQGYELFDVETIGNKKIFRLQLKPKK